MEKKDISQGYIKIQGWMVSKLELKSNDLLVYALIFGFSQDGESRFTGSIDYICTWLNCSRPTASASLSYLTEKNLIIKNVINMSGVTFNHYHVNIEVVKNLYGGSKDSLQGGSKESLQGGSKESLHYTNTVNTDRDKKICLKDFDFSKELTNSSLSYKKNINRIGAVYRHLKDEDPNNITLVDHELLSEWMYAAEKLEAIDDKSFSRMFAFAKRHKFWGDKITGLPFLAKNWDKILIDYRKEG
jgi:predicted transcriptional regulator